MQDGGCRPEPGGRCGNSVYLGRGRGLWAGVGRVCPVRILGVGCGSGGGVGTRSTRAMELCGDQR